MKNTIIGLLSGLVIALLAFIVYTQKPVSQNDTPPITPTLIEVTPVPSLPTVSDEDLIKQALADKYHKPLPDVNFTLSQKDSTHASGGVTFSGEISGAWVLAAKSDGQWLIVQDGNGTVSCETVAPYNFPVSMVPECVDQNGHLKKL